MNKELEETQEALRRCRDLLSPEKELNGRLIKTIKNYENKE